MSPAPWALRAPSASHNWSWDVYMVTKVREMNFGVKAARAMQEELQQLIDAAED